MHLTTVGIICCLVSPMMKFAARTIQTAFGFKEDSLVELFGRDSSLTDIFYCHGMIGVFVMLYL